MPRSAGPQPIKDDGSIGTELGVPHHQQHRGGPEQAAQAADRGGVRPLCIPNDDGDRFLWRAFSDLETVCQVPGLQAAPAEQLGTAHIAAPDPPLHLIEQSGPAARPLDGDQR